MEELQSEQADAFQTDHSHDAHRMLRTYPIERPHDSQHDSPPTATELATVPRTEHEQHQHGPPSKPMNELALEFVKSIDDRFGKQSEETIGIYNTLFTFMRGEISKRQALSTISNTLGYQLDLKYQLVDILKHEDARWGPDDFDIPLLPPPQPAPAPAFLQPAHQPQMRVPSMSNLWGSNDISSTVTNSKTLNSQAQNDLHGRTVNEGDARTAFEHEQGHRPVHDETTSGVDQPMHQAHDEQPFSGPELPHASAPVTSVSDNPFAVYAPRDTITTPVRLRQRRRASNVAPNKIEHKRQKSSLSIPASGAGKQVSPKNADPVQLLPEEELRFIHGLCGKGFTRRSKVKKHHWGGKLNDVNTTTGCWAKHKKPANVAWDDHISCKESPRQKPQFKAIEGRPIISKIKASEVPSVTPDQCPSLPSLPTLSSAPQRGGHPIMPLLEPPHIARHDQDPFHVHHLSTSSPFESLLTAVNVASSIEAPVAHGRTQSVVDQLDAQAHAAERAGQHIPTWLLPPYQQPDGIEHYQHANNVEHFQHADNQHADDFEHFQHTNGVEHFQHTNGVEHFQHTNGVEHYQHTNAVEHYQHAHFDEHYQHMTGFEHYQHTNGIEHHHHIQPPHDLSGQAFGTSPVHTSMWMSAPQLHAEHGNSYAPPLVSPMVPTFQDPWTAASRSMGHASNSQRHVYEPHEWVSPRASMSPGPENQRRRMC